GGQDADLGLGGERDRERLEARPLLTVGADHTLDLSAAPYDAKGSGPFRDIVIGVAGGLAVLAHFQEEAMDLHQLVASGSDGPLEAEEVVLVLPEDETRPLEREGEEPPLVAGRLRARVDRPGHLHLRDEVVLDIG